jgi:methylenetetrahydrofolate reductase (NADPH)
MWWLYKEETEYLLVDCHYLESMMALRGDAMKDDNLLFQKIGNNFAVDLVQQIKLLNEGICNA